MNVVLDETILQGGRTTPGVVLVGNTVRRPPNSNSGFVRRLLDHLGVQGFEGAPRWLGADDTGREIFSYLEGEVPSELGFVDDGALRSAALLIRRFHDLTVDLVRTSSAGTVTEVVCHNDLSPCNFVFRSGVPVGMIDFDAASPGTRAHDLGYAAWLWLDVGSSEIAAPEQMRRLRLFAHAYDGMVPEVVLNSMLKRQRLLIAEGQRRGNVAMFEWASRCLEWTQCHSAELRGQPSGESFIP